MSFRLPTLLAAAAVLSFAGPAAAQQTALPITSPQDVFTAYQAVCLANPGDLDKQVATAKDDLAEVITLDGRAAWKVETRFNFRWDPDRFPDPKAALATIRAPSAKESRSRSCATPPGRMKAWFIRSPVISSNRSSDSTCTACPS